MAREHARIANRRRGFLHQHGARLVARCALIATEPLNVKGMTASGGACKTGLNSSILDTAPSTFLTLLKSKAKEAGLQWCEVPTRQVKPSQTCHRCGEGNVELGADRCGRFAVLSHETPAILA